MQASVLDHTKVHHFYRPLLTAPSCRPVLVAAKYPASYHHRSRPGTNLTSLALFRSPIPEYLLTFAALPEIMVVYEKTHDYVERVTSILYNMLRSGVPLATAMQQIEASLTQTAVDLYPIHPSFVSATYFTLKAARYCKTTFLCKPATKDNPHY
jgi:hypothetical protein